MELEFLHPIFNSNGSSYSGYAITLSSRIKLVRQTFLVVELPFVKASYTSISTNQDESSLGNPYIGIQFSGEGSKFFGEIGFRPPFMPEKKYLAESIGLITDFDRFEAYVPNYLQVSGAVNFQTQFSPVFGVRIRLGPSVNFRVKGNSDGDLYAAYAVLLEFQKEQFSAGGGYAARSLLTRSGVTDRTVDAVEFSAKIRFDRIQPGVQVRLPLDEYLSITLDMVYGISVGVVL